MVIVSGGVTATLQGVTISGGNAELGGGIFNSGTLTLANSAVGGRITVEPGRPCRSAGRR